MINKYRISNLDCPMCAEKIREKVLKLDGINNVKVDFFNKILEIQTEEKISNEFLLKIKKCVVNEEPGVEVSIIDSDNVSKFNYLKKDFISKDVFEIILSAMFLIIGTLLQNKIIVLTIIFFVISALICGRKIFLKGIKSIIKFKFDEKSLLTIAVIAAFLLGEMIEAVAVVLLFRIGDMLEGRAVHKSRSSIKEFSKIIPDKVNLLINGKEKKVSSDKIKVGDTFLIHPFERIPCDGLVIDGSSEIDQSAITGESIPVFVSIGDELISGSINTSGNLVAKSTKIASESTASRILNLIENAVSNKSNSENIITRFARVYTPIILILALIITIIPPIFGFGNFIMWVKRALVLLVASCPCAIVISVPLAFCTGIGLASTIGVLFKGGKYLEILSKVDSFAFDKTATLTKGELSIENIYSFNNLKEQDVLKIAASMERYSSHPIANAIKNKFSKKTYLEVENIREFTGFGIKGKINNKEILCGNKEFLLKNNIIVNSLPSLPLYISLDKNIIGGMSFIDGIRHDAKSTIADLKRLGIKNVAILSGDNKLATERVAKECKIENYYYKLMPEDKLRIFKDFKKKSIKSAFIGDGVNDAPTLVAADCGIAMGLGTNVAIESSDVILTGDNIKVLSKVITLSRRVMNVIKANIIFSLLLKFFVLILACFGLAPMWLAVLSDTGVTFLAILNSSLFIKIKK